MLCPLCQSDDTQFYFQDKKREYQQCNHCYLVFVPPAFWLSAELEKAEYDKHENSLDDEGYLRFLSRMITPITEQIPAPADGLDFGCGPAPALAHYMKSNGYRMELYDLYYFPDRSVLDKQYNFVTSTEVIEHIAAPVPYLKQLMSLVKPGGLIGLMTKLVIDQDRFATWHYKNDPTHICFYSKETFNYIAKQYELDVEFIGQDVMLLTSKG